MFTRNDTVLLVIDIQEKLLPSIHAKEEVVNATCRMVSIAGVLGIPVMVTEQYPEGIGPTVPEIRDVLETDTEYISKRTFSCCGEPKFIEALERLGMRQVLLTGIETHVCVFQTAAQLLSTGYSVQVIREAVSSRTEENRLTGLQRMERLGADISSIESASFELLETSDCPEFKKVLKLIK